MIKFEIVREPRIEIAPPAEADRICGIYTLTPLALAAGKLLANADRWADDAVYEPRPDRSRDDGRRSVPA